VNHQKVLSNNRKPTLKSATEIRTADEEWEITAVK
jgi:hypothetical protein